MGVKLGKLIYKQEINFESLKGKTIAIDFSNYAYQFLSSIRQQDGTLLMDSNGNVTSHLMGIWTRFSNLISKGIKLVIVLDGEMPLLKKRTSQGRLEKKEIAKGKFEAAKEENDFELMNLYAKQTSFLTKEMINESKELLEAMGLPVIQAPAEADAQMAYLSKNNHVWAAATSDVDPLLHGCKRTITNLTLTQRKKLRGSTIKITPELIDLEENLKKLYLTQEQFIALAIIIGTDYNQGIKGIGPKKALKLIHENKNNLDDLFLKLNIEYDWKEIFELFENMKIKKDYKLEWKKPDKNKIKEILIKKHDFNEERVNKVLESLEISNKSFEQKGLANWE